MTAAGAGRADLHCHTTASDGSLSPGDVARLAADDGVAVLAVTDHDTMEGVPAAAEAGARRGVTVVPGVELSTRFRGRSLHVLGYFAVPDPPGVRERLAELREARVGRARRMVDRLAELGVPVAWERVVSRATGTLGRPHIADALVAAGHARDRADAFDRYLGDDGPAFVPPEHLAPGDAVRMVRDAGGAAVLAHPLQLRLPPGELRELVSGLAAAGLAGMEVHRPDHDSAGRDLLTALAGELGLVPTGGSDFHRPDGAVRVGDTGPQEVPASVVRRLLPMFGVA